MAGMTAETGQFMKKNAAVAAGAIMALDMASPAVADSGAEGVAVGSPGSWSGNVTQIPVHVPVNVCGNTVNVVALQDPAIGNQCVND
jgi:hypothetical protein